MWFDKRSYKDLLIQFFPEFIIQGETWSDQKINDQTEDKEKKD
jgi:hypothetical protein